MRGVAVDRERRGSTGHQVGNKRLVGLTGSPDRGKTFPALEPSRKWMPNDGEERGRKAFVLGGFISHIGYLDFMVNQSKVLSICFAVQTTH
jgi:hypothetical protein